MRIGIIGFGFMGGVHLAAIEEIEGASVVAVASRTKPSADAPTRGNLSVKSGTLPDSTTWYEDWHKLVDDPAVDAVDICLPTHLHQEVATYAFSRGKHVLCEKPMALTTVACDAMLEAAQRSGRTFMVAHVLRFLFPYQYAQSFLHETCGGDVQSCTLYRETGYPQWSPWLASEATSGGAILDLLCHDIDQAIRLFGAPRTVSAVSQGEVDTIAGTLHYDNGIGVRIEGGWRAPEIPFAAGFRIAGKDALLTFEAGVLTRTLSGDAERIEFPENREYIHQIAYFVECCRKHEAPTLCLPAESALAVQVANLLKTSRERNGEELVCAL